MEKETVKELIDIHEMVIDDTYCDSLEETLSFIDKVLKNDNCDNKDKLKAVKKIIETYEEIYGD